MKKSFKKFVVIAALGFIATGCGKSYTGTYSGTETLTLSQNTYGMQQPTTPTTPTQTAAPIVNPITITLNQGENNSITGTWQTTTESGTLVGVAGAERIENVTLTIAPQAAAATTPTQQPQQYPNQYPQQYPNYTGTGVGCVGTYTGYLPITNSQITGGVLTSTANSSCPGSKSVTANKTL